MLAAAVAHDHGSRRRCWIGALQLRQILDTEEDQ